MERFDSHQHAARIAFRVGQCYYKDEGYIKAGGSFDQFAKRFPGTVIFTGCWPGFVAGCRDSFRVRELIGVGFRPRPKTSLGNPRGFITASPLIFLALWRFRPDLVFVRGFDLCTIYAILLKVLTRCSLVLLWGGVGPHVTYLDNPVRLALRRLTARWFDHSMSHTKDGVDYLREVVEIERGIGKVARIGHAIEVAIGLRAGEQFFKIG